jgi:hypothetical protein
MSLVQLVCRLTKFAWLDEGSPAIKEIVQETNKFLQATFHHCIIGLKLLNSLVTEMNYKNKNRSLTQHRKVAVSFRDVALYDVFEISLSMLNSLATRAMPFSASLSPNEAVVVEGQLLDQALNLLLQCLNFDFIGVLPDEASDEAATLQVPNSWKERIQTGSTLRLLFNLYKGCTTGKIPLFVDASAPPVVGSGSGGASGVFGAPVGSPGTTVFGSAAGGGGASQPMRDFSQSSQRASQTLECISCMISVRRSLFSSDAERKRFLVHIMRGVCEILREKQGLKDEDCYHSFCKLLSRIKNNQQLNELIRSEGYAEWVSLTANFTIEACGNPSWSTNSMHYILGLWGRLVASVPYARLESSGNTSAMAVAGVMGVGSGTQGGGTSSMPDVHLDRYVPNIVGAYIRGRVDQVTGPNQEFALDELADLENIEDQLENMPILCRYMYEESTVMIRSIMDPLMARYEQAWGIVRSSQGSVPQHVTTLRVLECQLAYMVAIIGAVIGGGGAHASTSSAHALMRATTASQSVVPLGDEAFDAELCRQVFTLMVQGNRTMNEFASRLPSALAASQDSTLRMFRVDSRLDSAILYFMDQFRKAFICDASGMPPPLQQVKAGEAAWSAAGSRLGGESSSSSSAMLMRPSSAGAADSRVRIGAGSSNGMMDSTGGGGGGDAGGSKAPNSYQEMLATATGRQRTFLMMFDRMGLGDHCVIVTHMVLKLANNLRFWGDDDSIIRRSNDVLRDLVFSFASGRLLLTIDDISQMLLNHGQQYFPFLANPRNVRHRTTFYTSLARLVFFEDDSERFDPFIAPILSVLDSIAPSVSVRDDRIAVALIGVTRDLRGILAAAHNKSSYNQCFDALFPHHIDTLLRGLEMWADKPSVTTSVLKFFSEVVMQRGSRIAFGNSSANGILLFKRASQAIIVYGTRLSQTQTPSTDAYALRYKGIYISAQILARCIDGGFVNFGVLEHYQDRSFSQSLEVVLQLLLGISPPDLATFPKLLLSYMTVMHYVCRSHLDALASLPPQAFLQAVRSISDGLDSLDQEITSQAASALDQLSSQFVRLSKKDTPLATQLRNQVTANQTMFQTLMTILFQILVFSEQANHYTLARPMLPVLLAADAIQPDVMQVLQAKLVSAQPLEHQERMLKEFENLTKDISKSLDALNRDKFLQRLSAFRIAVREFAIV